MNRSPAWLPALCAAFLLLPAAAFSQASSPKPQPAPATRGTAHPKPVQADPKAKVASAQAVKPKVVAKDLRDLPLAADPAVRWDMLDHEMPEPRPRRPKPTGPAAKPQPPVTEAPMPSPGQNFAGLGRSDTCTGGTCGSGWPPDPNGDAGPNHYVQAVNTAFAVYSKAGVKLASTTFNSLWAGAGTGTPCDSQNRGDPVVLYDPMGDRWFVTDFAFGLSEGYPVAPCYECIAVSRTPDPVSGGWYLYAINQSDPPGGSGLMNDYPRFGVWPDGLYQSANMFAPSPPQTFWGAAVWAYDRLKMEAGEAITPVVAGISGGTTYTLLPANLRIGPQGAFPPAGSPEYLVSQSLSAWAFEVRTFTVDWGPGTGTLSSATSVPETSYTYPDSTGDGYGNPNIVPEPDTTCTVDSLGDRLMQQGQYRNVGGTESLWVTHTVRPSVSSMQTASQWAQIAVTGGTVSTTAVQQQIYNPDTSLYRWMSSSAVDHDGNMALAYSTSNADSQNYPSLQYSGRLSGDPLNQLPQTETALHAGTGSETTVYGYCVHRWGDYSALTVDPSDDCTFWYTNEHFPVTGYDWQTRIGSFKFTQCSDLQPGSLAVTVKDCAGSPIPNAVVVIDRHGYGDTVSDGTFKAILTPGQHTLAAIVLGATTPVPPVTISTGSTANVTITAGSLSPAITPAPASVCSGSAGDHASGPDGMDSYAWAIANGTLTSAANVQNVTYTAGSSGHVTLYLAVTSGADCGTSASAVAIGAVPAETAAGLGPANFLQWPDPTQLQWPANASASSYALYRGDPAHLPDLLTGAVNSCTRYSGTATGATALTEVPSPGTFYWYLVTGVLGGCEGPAGYATGSIPELVNGTGTCP